MFEYQINNSLEFRKKESIKIFDKNPNKIPVICEKEKKMQINSRIKQNKIFNTLIYELLSI